MIFAVVVMLLVFGSSVGKMKLHALTRICIYIYIYVCVYIMPYRLENCRSVGSGCSFCRNSEYRLSKAPFCSVVAFRKAFVSSARTDIWCVEPAVLVKIPTGCLISNKYNWT